MRKNLSREQAADLLKRWKSKSVVVHDEFGLREKLRIIRSEPDVEPGQQPLVCVAPVEVSVWPLEDNMILGTLLNIQIDEHNLFIETADVSVRPKLNAETTCYESDFGSEIKSQ